MLDGILLTPRLQSLAVLSLSHTKTEGELSFVVLER